jgi:hypothetical protein
MGLTAVKLMMMHKHLRGHDDAAITLQNKVYSARQLQMWCRQHMTAQPMTAQTR